MKKTGRNEKCNCGSGKKYKKCCLWDDEKNEYKAERISVFNAFSVMTDPRDNRGKKYKLIDLIIMDIWIAKRI